VLGFCGSALAIGTSLNTGIIWGTYNIDRNNEDYVEAFVEEKLNGIDITFLETENYENDEVKWGSSTFSENVYYYTVKVSGRLALYQIIDGARTVNWANETIFNDNKNKNKNKELQLQDVSHVTFWSIKNKQSSSQVPIPASVFLFGSGLLGVLGLVRTRKKQSH